MPIVTLMTDFGNKDYAVEAVSISLLVAVRFNTVISAPSATLIVEAHLFSHSLNGENNLDQIEKHHTKKKKGLHNCYII